MYYILKPQLSLCHQLLLCKAESMDFYMSKTYNGGDEATVTHKLYFEIYSAENKTESYSFIPVQDVNTERSVGQSEQQVVVTVKKQQFKLGKFSFWPKPYQHSTGLRRKDLVPP